MSNQSLPKQQEATVSIPSHQLFESPNSRSIELGPWLITVTTNPISNAPECDTLQATLGIPIPEMTFGRNSLKLEHRPSNWRYSFTTRGALAAVKVGELGDGDGGVKVGYAEKWLKSRQDFLPLHHLLCFIFLSMSLVSCTLDSRQHMTE
jgi:type 2A phosphatase activator TIP41